MKLAYILENIQNKMKLIEKAASPNDAKDQRRISKLKADNNLDDTLALATFLSDFDPTGTQAAFVLWILRTYIKDHSIRLPEDGDRIRRALYKFSKVKNNRSYSDEKDIFKIGLSRGLGELEAIVGKYKDDDNFNSIRGFKNFIQKNRSACLQLIYSDKEFKYLLIKKTGELIDSIGLKRESGYTEYIPKDLATAEELANNNNNLSWWSIQKGGIGIDIAAYVLADMAKKGTTWCVANEHTADRYLGHGPMHIMYKNGGPYYLATDDYSEVMSSGNEQIPLSSRVSYKLLIVFARMILDDSTSSHLSIESKKAMRIKLTSSLPHIDKDDRLSDVQKQKLNGLFQKAIEAILDQESPSVHGER